MNQMRIMPPYDRPIRVFVGSSSEDLETAEVVVKGLQHWLPAAEVKGWWSIFSDSLTKMTFEVLTEVVRRYDFGVFLLSPTDERIRRTREDHANVPRDNVVFEMGLFIGRKGRERGIGLWEDKATLPSDWASMTFAPYKRKGQSLETALKQIAEHIKKLGPTYDLSHLEESARHLIDSLMKLEFKGEQMVANAFPGCVLRGEVENYALARKIIDKACKAGHVIYESSTSQNGQEYEEMWEALLMENVQARPAKAWRLFFTQSEWCRQKLSNFRLRRTPSWMKSMGTDWPVDILLVANQNEEPLEALIGISSQGNNWMALYSVDPTVVRTLYKYVDTAAEIAGLNKSKTTTPKKSLTRKGPLLMHKNESSSWAAK